MLALSVPVLLAACDEQFAATATWLEGITFDDLMRDSALPGWSLAQLVVHIVGIPTALTGALSADRPPRGVRPRTVAGYTAGYAPAAAEIAERARRQLQDVGAGDLTGLLGREWAAMRAATQGVAGDPILAARRGPIRLSDLLRTRANELVMHSRDLERSLPGHRPMAYPRSPLGIAVRMLAETLAERHPGKSVEVRVPPYAAVQCIEGTRHTRGTPPNVVETDPLTFLDVASGRLSFAGGVESGAIRASGSRADLGGVMPLLG